MFGYICAAISFTTNTIIGIAMVAVAALVIVLMSVFLRGPSDDESPSNLEETPVIKEEPAVEEHVVEEPAKETEEIAEESETTAEDEISPQEEDLVDEAVEEKVEEVAEYEETLEVIPDESQVLPDDEIVKVEEEEKEEKTAVETPVEDVTVATVAEDARFPKIVAKKRTFAEKVRDLSDENKEIYNMLKNQLMSYDGIKNRVTKSNDIFRYKRDYVAKISILGKTVKLHLALNPEDYAVSKYHHKDLSAKKKYAKVPLMLKLKSQRSKKFAVEFISDAMKKAGREKVEESNVDFVKEIVAAIAE